MNDQLFVQELAAVLNTNSFAAVRDLFIPAGGAEAGIFAGQAAAEVNRPTLTISGTWQPYFVRRKGEFSCEIRSRVGDGSVDHHARFEALWIALLGAQGETTEATRQNRDNAKTALKAALQMRGSVQLIEYGPAMNAVAADVDGDDLRTVITMQAAWAFIPL